MENKTEPFNQQAEQTNIPEELMKPLELESLNEEVPNLKTTIGTPLAQGVVPAKEEEIVAALKAVQDPELMLDIYELGLIYELKIQPNGDVYVLMTLTSPTCPIAGDMPSMVANAVASVPGTGLITVELTFDPPWTMDRMSDDIKILMGFDSLGDI